MKILKPLLARKGMLKDLDRKKFIFEPKMDGVRAILIKNRGRIKLLIRGQKNIISRFPEFGKLGKFIDAKSCILDGEIIVYNKEGLSDYKLLEKRTWPEKRAKVKKLSDEFPATFVVFDILKKNGRKLTELSLMKRKEELENTVAETKYIEVSYYTSDGRKLWERIERLNMEGVVAKQRYSKYHVGKRMTLWLKIKNIKTAPCVIVGYKTEKKKVTSLGLGLYKKGLHFYGWVSGLDDDSASRLYKLLSKSKLKTKVTLEDVKDIQWVKPVNVCEIKYAEVDSKFKGAKFIRIRYDKVPKDCNVKEL